MGRGEGGEGGGEGDFFFQAEDGIRDSPVTGVQTCALPILPCPTYNQYIHLVLPWKVHYLIKRTIRYDTLCERSPKGIPINLLAKITSLKIRNNQLSDESRRR
mgnify:CR=1 FL=1